LKEHIPQGGNAVPRMKKRGHKKPQVRGAKESSEDVIVGSVVHGCELESVGIGGKRRLESWRA
jgi:hypothetical protein